MYIQAGRLRPRRCTTRARALYSGQQSHRHTAPRYSRGSYNSQAFCVLRPWPRDTLCPDPVPLRPLPAPDVFPRCTAFHVPRSFHLPAPYPSRVYQHNYAICLKQWLRPLFIKELYSGKIQIFMKFFKNKNTFSLTVLKNCRFTRFSIDFSVSRWSRVKTESTIVLHGKNTPNTLMTEPLNALFG